ncbi:hypothetical protein ABT099_23820 [Streptomyces prasinus]|uniref:hypothetical protein n=1 Tax=Streptomyces prasinus TaxID=67345 RepID=UPI00331B1225
MSRRAHRRWTLRNVEIFKHYMQHPGRGESFSVRTLAEESGVSAGVIGKLIAGKQDNVDIDDAIALAETVGSTLNPLFAPPSSPNLNRTSRKSTPTNEE